MFKIEDVEHRTFNMSCFVQKLSAVSLCSRITIEDIETNPWGRHKGQVLHQMMHIPPLRLNGSAEVVLWDTGSDTNYVRLEHVIKQGFPNKYERCITMTIGD